MTSYTLIESSTDINKKTKIIAEATFINQKLAWLISGAETVTIEDVNSLKIIKTDSGNQIPYVVFVSAKKLYLSRDSDLLKIIMSEDYEIEDVVMEINNNIFSLKYSLEGVRFSFLAIVNE